MNTRAAVLESPDLRGLRLARALCTTTDAWLRDIWDHALENWSGEGSVSLVALGGYGRGELAPYSDLDVMLLHDGHKEIEDLAQKVWYPIWDAGLKLGHSVCTIEQALDRAADDLDSATALVSVRTIAGHTALGDRLAHVGLQTWRDRARRNLPELMDRVRARQATYGEVAYLLEPNLKEGYGGLRDIHAVSWAEAAGVEISRSDRASLESGRDILTNVRVALHRLRGRADDVVRLEDQDALAQACGYVTADAMMSSLSSAARTVAWVGDEVWARVVDTRRRAARDRAVDSGMVLRQGEVHLDDSIDPRSDPTLLIRVATAAARNGARIHRHTLDRLAQQSPSMPAPWPAGAVDDLVGLLLTGHAAIPVIESLDQRGLWVKILPEWAPNRARPQRNAYHRFTVDRHLWETAANAARLADQVVRPDLLVLGALFHDIGKGYAGDHSQTGVDVMSRLAPRLGLSATDTAVVLTMVRHHLLLSDVATRRDLADPATITHVASVVDDPVTLDLLRALSEADGLATGPSAWSSWKADLVDDLVQRVHLVLGGADLAHVQWRLFPDAMVLEIMARGVDSVITTTDSVTIVSADRPGTFSRVTGVLALHGLDVLSAQAHSDEQGMAASQFKVVIPDHGPIDWEPITVQMYRALRGELAIEARLAERARHYRPKRRQSATISPTQVTFVDNASSNATVIDVRTPDRPGVLHMITRTLAELGLDIRHATVHTIGDDVVDSFYVRTADKTTVTDDEHRREIERAVVFTLSEAVSPP